MGHWYNQDGTTKYRIIGKNGRERDTTLADAKKLKLLYSTTEICGVPKKPALDRWKLEKMIESSIDVGAASFMESVDTYKARMWRVYNEKTGVYAREGTAIHDALENYYRFGVVDLQYKDIVIKAANKIETLGYNKYIAESSFANQLGYGGKIDLIIGNNEIILDFKTKRGTDLSKKQLRDDYCIQLAAYRHAINSNARCMNCLISTDSDIEPELHEWSSEELDRGWELFSHLLAYTKLANNYDSSYNE